ncbi:hypothetical protein [Collibacillus ludicampi]|uniref:hypothetical protein n=1 Tax=Collibacillus ludicampi TaxID=2771369 RepID=UPI0024951676|nr:hypothetical protein [Collibacillus ludicampi]
MRKTKGVGIALGISRRDRREESGAVTVSKRDLSEAGGRHSRSTWVYQTAQAIGTPAARHRKA